MHTDASLQSHKEKDFKRKNKGEEEEEEDNNQLSYANTHDFMETDTSPPS